MSAGTLGGTRVVNPPPDQPRVAWHRRFWPDFTRRTRADERSTAFGPIGLLVAFAVAWVFFDLGVNLFAGWPSWLSIIASALAILVIPVRATRAKHRRVYVLAMTVIALVGLYFVLGLLHGAWLNLTLWMMLVGFFLAVVHQPYVSLGRWLWCIALLVAGVVAMNIIWFPTDGWGWVLWSASVLLVAGAVAAVFFKRGAAALTGLLGLVIFLGSSEQAIILAVGAPAKAPAPATVAPTAPAPALTVYLNTDPVASTVSAKVKFAVTYAGDTSNVKGVTFTVDDKTDKNLVPDPVNPPQTTTEWYTVGYVPNGPHAVVAVVDIGTGTPVRSAPLTLVVDNPAGASASSGSAPSGSSASGTTTPRAASLGKGANGEPVQYGAARSDAANGGFGPAIPPSHLSAGLNAWMYGLNTDPCAAAVWEGAFNHDGDVTKVNMANLPGRCANFLTHPAFWNSRDDWMKDQIAKIEKVNDGRHYTVIGMIPRDAKPPTFFRREVTNRSIGPALKITMTNGSVIYLKYATGLTPVTPINPPAPAPAPATDGMQPAGLPAHGSNVHTPTMVSATQHSMTQHHSVTHDSSTAGLPINGDNSVHDVNAASTTTGTLLNA